MNLPLASRIWRLNPSNRREQSRLSQQDWPACSLSVYTLEMSVGVCLVRRADRSERLPWAMKFPEEQLICVYGFTP